MPRRTAKWTKKRRENYAAAIQARRDARVAGTGGLNPHAPSFTPVIVRKSPKELADERTHRIYLAAMSGRLSFLIPEDMEYMEQFIKLRTSRSVKKLSNH